MPSITNVDVCIVGAGIVGLTLAYRLRKLGKRVVVLERGDRQPSQRSVGEELENLGTAYSGGIHGRAFGLGGTSGLWGGQLVSTTTAERGTRPWLDMALGLFPMVILLLRIATLVTG